MTWCGTLNAVKQLDNVNAMRDNEIAEIVNKLTKVAIHFHDTQQLRERIADIIVPALKNAPTSLEETTKDQFWFDRNDLKRIYNELINAKTEG
jgi:hypothetical protein